MNAWFRGQRSRLAVLAILAALAFVSWRVANSDPKFIGDWFVNLAAPAQTAFVLWYSTVRPWRYPGPGRAVWVKAAALAVLLDVILLAKHWPTFPQLKFIAAFGEVLIVVGIYYQLSAFARQRWELRQTDRAHARRDV